MRPKDLSPEKWAELTPNEQQCVELFAAEFADRRRGGRPVDVWPIGWTDAQIRKARQAGLRIYDPRAGKR